MIGICDENKNNGMELQHRVQQICQLYEQQESVVLYENVNQLMDLLSQDGPGGCLAARRLRELDQKVPLIFLTDTSQYAVMGVRLHLTDYVVKPAEFKHLVRALKLAGIGNGR